jgi:WD40 repeat protein/class 3 adenylate cyclase
MATSATATFLFCDLVGSTALLTRIGDDAGDDVRRRCFTVFREAVAEYRGTEVKTMGDGLLALFPQSVSDAVGCGIAMQRGVARLDHESPLLGLGLRVGVAVGEAANEDNDWFGTPVVEAARLCAAATKGQILVTDLARQLVRTRGGYRFTSLGAMELKGLEPVLVSEAAWEPEPGTSVVPLPTALEPRGQLPFVGRQRERAALDAAWRRVDVGRLGVVVVTGEQGVGKTRLLAEWARSAHATGSTVLYGCCRRDAAEPYEPFAEALAWYVTTAPAADLRAQLGPLGGELVRIVPSLLTRFADLPRPELDAGGARRRLFESVDGLLTAAATASPILLVLDALELAPPPTLSLLQQLVESPARRSVLVVAIATDVPDQRMPLAEIRSRPEAEVLNLAGLTDADVQLLVATSTGRAVTEVAEQAAALRAETEGNPALIGQLLAELEGGGAKGISLPCPYKGLAPFQPEDHELFYGREEVVANVLARLGNGPLLAVGGASGSGKSSVVRAGMLPGVWHGALPGSSAWRTVVMVPGAHPLAELAAQVGLLLHQGPAAVLRELETDRRALDLAARQLLVGASPAARLLLVIDQFEELFTICDEVEERDRFLDAILCAVGTPGARTSVVVVLRADFYGQAASVPALAAAIETNHILLGPMREDELRAAVERPARHVGLRLEPGLAEAVVADVLDQPGGLPLLSHALLETWKGRTGRTLTLAAYRTVGGARGAIARSADAVLAGMDPEERTVAKHIFLRLVEVGEGTEDTSRRAELSELNPDDDPRVASVLQQLTDARLLTANESTAEIAHEALIRSWPQLRDWLDEDREGLRLLGHLRTSSHEWDRRGRDPGELQRGARLAATLDLVAEAHPVIDDVERSYLEASRAAEEAELDAAAERARRDARSKRRLRSLLAAAAVLLVAVLLAGLLAMRQRNRADRAGTLAEARRLGTQALVVEGYDKALLLAVEGRHLDDSPETRVNLLAAIDGSRDAVGVIRSPSTGFVDVAASPDGKTLLVSGDRGEAQGLSAYDVATRQRRGLFKVALPVARAALSPDGRLAVVSDAAGLVNVRTERRLHIVAPDTLKAIGPPLEVTTPSCAPRIEGCAATNLLFSPDDRLVAAVTDLDLGGSTAPPAEALVWDVTKRGGPVLDFPFEAGTRQRDVAFLPDSKTILVAGQDGTAVVDIATGRQLRQIEGAFAPLALSPDGATLAATLDPATAVSIGLFDVATGQPTVTLPAGHTARIGRLAFSPDGATLASGGDDRLVMVWDVATGRRRAVFNGHIGDVKGLAFSPDSATLYSSALDKTVYQWDLRRTATLAHVIPADAHGSPQLAFRAEQLRLSPDSARVEFTSDEGNRFQFRDVATGALSEPSARGRGVFDTFSPDGRRILTYGEDRTLQLRDRATGAVLADLQRPGVTDSSEAFTPDGQRVVSAAIVTNADSSSTTSLQLLDAATLKSVSGRPLPLGRLAANLTPAVTSDGRQAVVFLTFGDTPPTKVVVVDLDPLRIIRSIPLEDIGFVWRSALAGDDRTVALGDPAGHVAIIDIRTGTESPLIRAHDEIVDSVSFSPDSKTLVTAGNDGAIKLWDTKSRRPLGAMRPLGANRLANAWFIGPSRVLIAYATGELFEWDTSGDAWEAHACAVSGRNFTKAEWAELFPNRSYRVTCPQYPAGK